MGSYVSPDQRRIVKTGSGRTKNAAKAKRKEVLRDSRMLLAGAASEPISQTRTDSSPALLRAIATLGDR